MAPSFSNAKILHQEELIKTRKATSMFHAYLRVLVEIATIPSGHCSDAKPEAYSSVS
jgi:hypothetical protein